MSLTIPRWLAAIAWASCAKGAVRVQVINECVGLVFECTEEDIVSGKCVAETGEQM